ncbi:MAG: MATE family efflux transporter [Planctomycetes bacterium]|nr:MATE family efflux transporter [Planctomycetota bacterium]
MMRPDSRLARHVLLFGLPLVLGLACHSLFNLVDTLLVGQLPGGEGTASIAVTGLCDPITTFQTILFNGPIAGAGVLMARAVGARDEVELRRVAMRATGFVVALSLAISLPGYLFAREIALAMGAQAGWQLQQCTSYLEILLGGGVTAGMFLYLTTIERSLGRTAIFMAFFMLSNVLNLGIGVFLIYGTGPHPDFVPGFVGDIARALNVPRLGVIGSAWSTFWARAIAGALLLAISVARGPLRGAWHWLVPQGKAVLELTRIGLWNNGQIAARGIAGGILIRTLQEAGGGNPAILGGIFVGLKIELVLILLAFGWGAAAQTLVATSLGAGRTDRARHEERLAILFATAIGTLLVVPLCLFAEQVSSLFNDDPALIEWSSNYLRLMAPALIVTPISIVISQAMVARNHLRTPVVVDSLVLLLGMAPALILVVMAGGGSTALIVINIVANLVLAAVYVGLRIRLLRRATAAT